MAPRKQSSYDSLRSRTRYTDGNVKEKGISKFRNNGATRHAGLLTIDTVVPDALGAMTAHCKGENSPQSSVSFIRRTTPPRTEAAMIETRDDPEAMFNSQSTPLAINAIPEILRTLVGGFGTQEARKRKRSNPSSTASSPGHATNTYFARPPAEMPVISEILLSSSERSCADEDIFKETRGTDGNASSSSHINGKELSPLSSPIPSNVNLPLTMLHNLEITTSKCSTSSVVDRVATCDDDMGCVNEGK